VKEDLLGRRGGKLKKTRGCVSHGGLAIYIKKYYLKAKEELWKLKYFTMPKI